MVQHPTTDAAAGLAVGGRARVGVFGGWAGAVYTEDMTTVLTRKHPTILPAEFVQVLERAPGS